MHHSVSILFNLVNSILTKIFGDPATSAPSWWLDGVNIAGLQIAGIAPRGEHGEILGWIPDHVVMALFVLVLCAVFFPIVSRSFRKGAPSGVQNVLELFVDFLRGVTKENIAHHPQDYLAVVGAFFFFIAISNLGGFFFFLPPSTANLNTTFALSISCFILYNAIGVKTHGPIGYLKTFMGPSLALAILVFPIELIGNFARMLSLAMRLYGNIFGEHTATANFVNLCPIIVPFPMNALSIFTAFLQAYVFTLLAAVYIGGATSHEH
jgi:F-type H+-transporting ATPase subunit a